MTFARSKDRAGFTLIELLVVIAIIAIIAAILFPVFAAVREKGRQATVISSFEKIQRGLGEFYQDQHHYPDALYGYTTNGPSFGSRPTNHNAPSGLFPQYISDPSVFVDPNNTEKDDPTDVTTSVMRTTNGALAADATTTRQYYKADSYDISPQMSDAATLSATTYVVRYEKQWVDITTAGQDTKRQLVFPNPPADTFVTCTTYHVPHGVVLALWLNGSARTVDANKYWQETGSVDANFWKITPGGH